MFKKFVMKYFHWIGNNKMYGTSISAGGNDFPWHKGERRVMPVPLPSWRIKYMNDVYALGIYVHTSL